MAAMAGHYITISITADRVENATGEVSNESRTVTWKLPVSMLMIPPPEFRQDIRADIIYDSQSWFDHLLSSVRFWKFTERPGDHAQSQQSPIVDAKKEQRSQLAAELLSSQKLLNEAKTSLVEAQSELEAANRRLAEQQALIEKILITKPRFWFNAQKYGPDQAVISFTLENKTTIAIKGISMEGTLQTPGRSVPWLKDSFSHDIKGGVEPGERREFDLTPNMFGEWGKVT